MPTAELKKFLDSHRVKYVTIKHSPSYTAQEVAASAHVPGNSMAKTVIIKVDGTLTMMVEPASHKINFDHLKTMTHAKEIELASESEFQQRFSECELGAMPPFGNLYGMTVYLAESLADKEEIAFNAGTHSELIKMKYEDFSRLVSPKVISI